MANIRATDQPNSKTKVLIRALQFLKIRKQDNQDKSSLNDIFIAVMGPTGAGKSSFINAVTGRTDAVVGHGLESCTKDMEEFKMVMPLELANKYPGLCSKNIVLVDTPGFDNSHLDDSEILQRMVLWLKSRRTQGVTISGIIYIQESTRTNLKDLKQLLNIDYHRFVLVTTCDKVPPQEEASREQTRMELWEEFIKNGAAMFPASAHRQILEHIISLACQPCIEP
ncbi:hypothetical protein FA15DRAFT_674372 [Coprinopsis marcescibilis]|uniref:G domain-containing protein n=1 Tax=Coprinopsis marcescibilis TaxID=230819 RepID=A0A5C3KH06_COPMA|nr:hypothetical protein FA15DRAFT_674372 [Coprinopsis marcescibilis]